MLAPMVIMQARTLSNARIFTDEDPSLGVRVAFTTRFGGVSAPPFDTLNLSDMVGDDPSNVETNRSNAERLAGFEPGSITLLKQVHGTDVIETEPGSCGVIGEGDALVVRKQGATAGVLTADCVPVLMVGPAGAVAAHAGWRGLVGGVIERAAEAIGGVAAAWVGPSIHACCYEVGPDVLAAFNERDLPAADDSHVDPGKAALTILRRLDAGRVAYADDCTSCTQDLFSYRRDGPVTGRQGGFIAWM